LSVDAPVLYKVPLAPSFKVPNPNEGFFGAAAYDLGQLCSMSFSSTALYKFDL
jgi:hypothetical protein